MERLLYFHGEAKESKARRGGIVWDVTSFFLLLTVFRFSQSLVCRKCENVYSLDECSNNITCNPGEVCFMDGKVIGQSAVAYSAGCRLEMKCSLLGDSLHLNGRRRAASGEYLACSRCCDSDECNARLCGIRHRNSTSSQCYYCDSSRSDAEQGDVISGEECQHITTCQPNEACGVQHNFQGDQQHKERYTCMHKLICRLTTQEALRRLDECATDPDPLICGNHGRRRSAAGAFGDVNYNNTLSEREIGFNLDKHIYQQRPIATDVSDGKAEVHVSKRDSTCSACCGDGLCNSGTCDEVLERLYHLWKENVLDFHTLSLKVAMPTVQTTTVQTTTPPTTTHPTKVPTHPTHTTHPTTPTTHTITHTIHPTTPTTHITTHTTHPTTPTTHTTTPTTHTTTQTTHTTTPTTHTTTPTTHTTTPTIHTTTPTTRTTTPTTHTTTPTTHTTTPTTHTTTPTTHTTTPTTHNTTPTTHTTTPTTHTTTPTTHTTTPTTHSSTPTTHTTTPKCPVILHCKQGHCLLDHEPVCDVCEDGYFPVKQNTSCFDLSSNQGSICKTPDHCYKIFTHLLNWKDAKSVCIASGGNLFVPESLDEEIFLEGYMNAMSAFTDFAVHNFWIGGHIETKDIWVDLKGNGIERWAIGLDFSLQTECAAFSGPNTFRWETLDCDRPSSFICKETKSSGASLIG